MITEAMLRQLWPHGDSKVPGLIAGIAAAAPAVFAKYGFTSDIEIAQAMAQFSHECGAGEEMVENRNYSAQRAAEVWPLHANDNDEKRHRHFSSVADCYAKCGSFAGDPDFHRKLLNLVYGTRMGNRPGTNDGYDLVGRGLSQVTAHDGYVALGNKLSLNLLMQPDLVNQPTLALEAGVADFVICGCLPFAKKDDTLNVTKHLNGGTVGLEEREQWLVKWKKALAGSPPVHAPPAQPVPDGTTLNYPPPPPPSKPKSKKNIAAGGVVIAGGAAAQQAHEAGVSPLVVVGIIVAAIAVAVGVWYVLHRRAANQVPTPVPPPPPQQGV